MNVFEDKNCVTNQLEWTNEQDIKLKELTETYRNSEGTISWAAVAAELPESFTNIACKARYKKLVRL